MIPLVVYRVYPDGRPDELVRGADIVGTPLASFAKILRRRTNWKFSMDTAARGVRECSGVGIFTGAARERDRGSAKKSVTRPPLLPRPASAEGGAE